MTNTTQNDDMIEVPSIEIKQGWTVDDIETVEDCDDAFAVLTEAVASIEYQMETMKDEGRAATVAFRKAKAALRWKKAAMQAVQTKRSKINRQAKQANQASRDRILLDEIRALSPGVFQQAVNSLAARGIQA